MLTAVFDESFVPRYADQLRLDGRRIVVLGAGQGMGRQTAHALAQVGARVICVDREGDLAERVAAETGGEAHAADVTDRHQVEAVFAAAAAGGRVHGFVDIVGAARFSSFLETSDEDWDWTFDMVLRHAFVAGQVGGGLLAESGGGTIVYVASISGLTSAPDQAAYGAAKAALMSLVRTMAMELAPSGVRVNAVAPGGTLTPRVLAVMDEANQRNVGAMVPLGRMALPYEMAGPILFLTSGLASYITAQVLVVDGGGHQKFPYAQSSPNG